MPSDEIQRAAVRLGVEVINGYVIIAERRAHLHNRIGRERVILGAKRALNGFDYVTAVAAPVEDQPTTWDHGHYFDMREEGRASANFEKAVRDFDNR